MPRPAARTDALAGMPAKTVIETGGIPRFLPIQEWTR